MPSVEYSKKTAIVYYSWSGTTGSFANKLAHDSEADLFRVKPLPEEPDHFLGALPHGGQFYGIGGLFLHASYLFTVQKVSSRRIASVQRTYDTVDFIIIS